jgi:4-hydroxy-L-threonine phosphate dehydrogenase PdxA
MRTSKLTKYKKIAITCGDIDGIGLEVTAKALAKLGPQKNCAFFIFRPFSAGKRQEKYLAQVEKKFGRFTFYSIESALVFFDILEKTKSLDSGFVFDLALKTSPAEWVIAATHLCKHKVFSSLVTGPISKYGIQRAGYPFVGHTGIFRDIFPKNNLYMAFVGADFSVLLATDHQPVSTVEKSLSQKKNLTAVFKSAQLFSAYFKKHGEIGVLGLNPHAGEKGILGSFEKKYLGRLPVGFSKPISPDAAFLKKNLKKFQFFLAMYHDQGLIPFKMHHGQDSGVHLTVGLPFIRTSVDHGTAKDIFNLNRANPASMIDAIKLNIKLLHGDKI